MTESPKTFPWDLFWPIGAIIPSSERIHTFGDLVYDHAGGLHAFYEITQFFDPYLSPAAYSQIDRDFCNIPENVFMRFFLIVDKFERDYRIRPMSPVNDAILEHATSIGRKIETYVEFCCYRKGIKAKFMDIFRGLTIPSPGNIDETLFNLLEESIFAIHTTADAFYGESKLKLKPLMTEDIARFFIRWLNLQKNNNQEDLVKNTARFWRNFYESTRIQYGHLAGALPLGDTEFTRDGIWMLNPDGSWRLWRFISVLDFFTDIPSDTLRRVVSYCDFPLRAIVSVFPVSNWFAMRQAKKRLNIQYTLAHAHTRSLAVEADVKREEAEEALRKLIKENKRILKLGLVFGVFVDVPSRDESNRYYALKTIRNRLTSLYQILSQIGARTHIESFRQNRIFQCFLPGSYHADRGRARQTYPDVVTNLLPIHMTHNRFRPDDEVVLFDRLWQPTTWSMFNPNEKNPENNVYSALITGKTRSGKSFFTNYLIECWHSFYKDNIRMIITDIGGSYVRTAHAIGCRPYNIGVSQKSHGFDLLRFLDPDDSIGIALASSIFADLAELNDNENIPLGDIVINLEKYLKTCKRENIMPTTSDFLHRTGTVSMRGPFMRMAGNVFAPPPEKNIDLNAKRILINVQDLSSIASGRELEKIQALVYRAIVAAYYRSVFYDRTPWKVLILDECWAFLSDRHMKEAIASAIRTFAKHRAGIIIITQGIGDIINRAGKEMFYTLINNVEWIFLFEQKYHEDMRYLISSDNESEQEIWEMLDIRTKHDGSFKYSECLVINPSRKPQIYRISVPDTYHARYQTTNLNDVREQII